MKLKLKEIKNEVGDVKTFVFEPSQPIHWVPGQFIHYTLPHQNVDDRGDNRWFTISSPPFEKNIHITTRIMGDQSSSFKKHLASMHPGDEIDAEQPDGDFVLDDSNKHYVFIAGGIGITPFHSIISELNHQGKDINIELLYANRDDKSIVFKDELAAIAKTHPNFTITYFIGDNRIDENALKDVINRHKDSYYYVSGPEPMVEAFEKTLGKLGLSKDQMHFDFFPGYKAE